jgi:DNA end-binding protein Ku
VPKYRARLTLRYPYEVRKQDEYFADIKEEKVPKDMLDLALHIVNTKRAEFNPEAFEDQYEDALKTLIEKKAKGEKIEPAKERPAPGVVNLMDALRASVDVEKKKAPAPSIRARRPAKRKASQK